VLQCRAITGFLENAIKKIIGRIEKRRYCSVIELIGWKIEGD